MTEQPPRPNDPPPRPDDAAAGDLDADVKLPGSSVNAAAAAGTLHDLVENEVNRQLEHRDEVAEATKTAAARTRKKLVGGAVGIFIFLELGGLIFTRNEVVLAALTWVHDRAFPETEMVAVSYEEYFELQASGAEPGATEGGQIRFYATEGQTVKLWWTIFPPDMREYVTVAVNGRNLGPLVEQAQTLVSITDSIWSESARGAALGLVGVAETNIHQLTFALNDTLPPPNRPVGIHPVIIVYGKSR